MEAVPYKTSVALATAGPTQVGPFLICANGLNGGHRRYGSRIKAVPKTDRRPVHRNQVEVAKELLRGCRPTRWARKLLSPVSSDLKHWAENWGGPDFVAHGQCAYVSTGAAIVAAIELGLICVPTGEGSRNVFIGVHFDDVAARMAQRGWYIARDHVTATRIKAPEPVRLIDPEFWTKWAAENGITLGNDCSDNGEQGEASLAEPVAPHPFWAAWAKENGINNEGAEG